MDNTVINTQLMKQIPGFFGILSLNSQFRYFNETGLRWTGYRSVDQIIDKTYADVPCKVSEDHQFHLDQDKKVLTDGHIKFLGYYHYADDQWRIILGEKYLLRDEAETPIGIVTHFNDCTHNYLLDIGRFLIRTTQPFTKKEPKKQFCYLIEECNSQSQFTDKELECLFFLLRGKSSKETGDLLNLSPRTIEKRIDELKVKMGCHYKDELIEKCIALGYLNTLPQTLFQKGFEFA